MGNKQPYKNLFTYWYALIIYDLTVEFCQRWIKSFKLREQMEGAGRSGKQNIVEGSEVRNTSLKIAIKLTNTAKGSIEELLADYEDYLRQRRLPIWDKSDPRVTLFRGKAAKLIRRLREPATLVQEKLPLPQNHEVAANLMLTLCHQATYLLHRQVQALEKKHQAEGGYTEKLYQRRKQHRGY